jgi:hypothetical protein
MLKDAIALNHDLRRQFICFENEGLFKVGLVLGYKTVSRSGAFDPKSVEIQVGTKDADIMFIKLADIQNAYIMMPEELVEYVNKSVEMGVKAQDTLSKIYSFLETLKAN